MAGNPTGAMGVPDYLGWDWKSKAGLPIVCVPGCPIQPDNLSETILYLLYQVAGQAPMIPLDDALRPRWLFEATVHQGCDRAGVLRGRHVRQRVRLARSAWSSWAAGGPSSSATCPSGAGSTASAAAPTSAASASPARCRASLTSSCRSWTSRQASRVSEHRQRDVRHGHPDAARLHRRARWTRNRSGGSRAPSFAPATRRRGDQAMTATEKAPSEAGGARTPSSSR